MFLLRQSLAPRLISVRRLHASSLLNGPLVPFKLADIGEGIAEVQVKEWYIKEGDRVHQFDNICEVQSDKAAVSITSRYDGIVKKLYYKVDDVAKVGKPLIDIELSDGEEILETEANVVPESASSVYGSISCEVPGTQNKKLATPAVDLSTVDGTGKGGRVLKEDVMRSLGQITKDPTPTSFTPHVRSDSAQTPKKSPLQPLKEDQVVPVRGYARAMVKSMSEALKIPHLGYNDEVNMDKVIELRNLLKKQEQERGIKMSYMPMFIKAASMALTKFPMINSCAHEKFENIIYKASHNICFAMDTPGGLVVPNIKNCEQRNLWEIAAELNRLIEAGKRQKISKEDITGGTFTLSNIGAIGGTSVNPIIFAPQVAIAGLGKIQNLPRVDGNGQVYTTHLVEVSWAADHRVVDGATVARFSNLFKVYLENLEIMIADMR
ncbi:hypothetical protein QR680_012301 [Steinernema hermaphroditum]|uniref:Dihydrolipoamide acetyltransferase component of pyruvate dehydrogenase complex n=1 Tax=Steinernema hermaphroditum TaxID=289476 RepID=A0AA39I3W6_9BILA|nr:hypothetical protein QR680_012301 [Steinernema hermaphroditum]